MMKPNLHVNVNSANTGRTFDYGSKSGSSTPSGYITPVNSTNGPFSYATPVIKATSRSNSVISMNSDFPTLEHCDSACSMTSSLASGSPVNPTLYEFTAAFDDALLSIYHNYANQPSVTPFNINFPPSGVCSKVARQIYHTLQTDKTLVIDKLLRRNEELMAESNRAQCLSLIRRRLLDLCNANADQVMPIVSRTNSGASINAPSRRPSWLHQNSLAFSSARVSSTDSLVDSVQPLQPQNLMQTPQPLQYSQLPSPQVLYQQPLQFQQQPHPPSYYPPEMMTLPPSTAPHKPLGSPIQITASPDQFTFENYTQLQSAPTIVRRHSLRSGSIGSQGSGGSTASAGSGSLSGGSSLKNVMEVDEDDSNPLFNVTSQRKRDSLKLKRNMK